MKKFIVTGGLGFIGSNLIDLLLQKNSKLLILTKLRILQVFIILKNIKKIKITNL